MRPRKGRLLSPERHNPGLKMFYEEFVLTDETFRGALGAYLDSHTILVSESTFKTGISRLRNYAGGKTYLVPRSVYKVITPVLELSQTEPYKATGVYPGMLFAYFFDRSGISMIGAVEKLKDEFAEVDENIASRLQEGKEHAVKCTMRDILIGRKGLTPIKLVRLYETKVIELLDANGLTPEQLREAFRGGIDGLESRLGELVIEAKRSNPKPYELVNGYVQYSFDYHKGDKIRHGHYGIGTVVDRESIGGVVVGLPPLGEGSYSIIVNFENKNIGTKKLVVNKRPRRQISSITVS